MIEGTIKMNQSRPGNNGNKGSSTFLKALKHVMISKNF